MNRLILFDIDGTLLSGGPAKDAFHQGLLSVFGTAGPIEAWEFSGKTDPQIARELLREAGLEDPHIDEGFPRLWENYLRDLEALVPERPFRSLLGVTSLLEALEAEAWARLGLLTGNLEGGARVKLRSAEIRVPFAVGAFGSDREERNDLPPVAMSRASRIWGEPLPPEEVVIVGDTPRDVECGLAHGTRTVGVATGRFSADELARAGAHLVLDDLTDTAEVLRHLRDC
ncbi:MAG: HAD family hydrolase [Gemmatimonadales bacterium]|nr:MAG: HAD family hydrolase [Gemmatimonadales bacterium]